MRWKNLFPRDRFFHEEDRLLFFVLPIMAFGIASLRSTRHTMFEDMLGVRANGWIITDIQGEISHYTADGTEATVHFRGTVPVVARNLREAVRGVNEMEFEAFGGIVEGTMRDVTVQIGRVINFCQPDTENTWMSVVGADQ